MTDENTKKLAEAHREIENILETGEKGKVIIFLSEGEIVGQEVVINRKY